jgi:hypothetical protein
MSRNTSAGHNVWRQNPVMCRFLASVRITLFPLALVLLSNSAIAATINIQPIRVCDDNGENCASVETFGEYFSKIYAQRGDTINFLPLRSLNRTQYLVLETSAEADELIGSTTGTQRSDLGYDMWFVSSIAGGGAGRGVLGGDGMVISDDIISLNRVDTPAHELGHNLGFNHTTDSAVDVARYLMAEGGIREIPRSLSDVVPDGRQLSRFFSVLPEITLDTVGSTPFQNTSFFNVRYLKGAASDLFLESITVDLRGPNAFTDPTNSPPGASGSPFGFSGLNGIVAQDISVFGIIDGSQIFTLTIRQGAFAPGESFSFGADIDLFSNIDGFGATPDELRTAIITFTFSNGYTVLQSLDDLVASTIIDPLANLNRPAILISETDPLIGGGGAVEVTALSTWSIFAAFSLVLGVGVVVLRRAP